MGILTEKVPAPTIKQQDTLPDTGRNPSPLKDTVPYVYQGDNSSCLKDNGGTYLPANALENTIPIPTSGDCLVKVFIIDVREGEYNASINAAEIIRRVEGMDEVELIPWSLKTGHGYDVKEVSFTAKIKNDKNLTGSFPIGPDQFISFRKMSRLEVDDATKFIEAGDEDIENGGTSLEKGLVSLSKELEGTDWKLICAKETPGQGTKAVLIRKKKIESLNQPEIIEQPKLAEATYQEAQTPANPYTNTINMEDIPVSAEDLPDDRVIQAEQLSKFINSNNVVLNKLKDN